MINKSKCNKCSLVNPPNDVVCRRCGGMLGMPVYNSPSEEKARLPKYLLLVPVLLVAAGLGYWYSQTKKSAIDSTHVAKELMVDKKVTPVDPPVAAKPRDFYDQLPPERREAARQALERDWAAPPVGGLSKETLKAQEEWRKMDEQYQEGSLLRQRSIPPH